EARRQEAEAKRQAAIADAVVRFQTAMLAAADPRNLLGDKVAVLQAMQAAVAELDRGALADQPLVEAHVRRTVGHTLFALGRPADAEPNLRKSLAIFRAAVPADHVACCLADLAWVLHDQNKLAEGETLYREALAINRAAYPSAHPDVAASLSNLGGILE